MTTLGEPVRFPAVVTGDKLSAEPRSFDILPDGRFIGFIERRRIVGKAVAVAFSLDRKKYFVPRFDRFFEGLE